MFVYKYIRFSDMWESYNPRTNGTIYKSHENINKVRKLVAALLDEDLEKAQSFYSSNATFYDINMPKGESMNLDQAKSRRSSFMKTLKFFQLTNMAIPTSLTMNIEHQKLF